MNVVVSKQAPETRFQYERCKHIGRQRLPNDVKYESARAEHDILVVLLVAIANLRQPIMVASNAKASHA